MTPDTLRSLIDQEIRQSVGYLGGKLGEQRRKAEAYYLAKPVGDLSPPEVEGRSDAVSTDVADTVEWMLPSLLRIFTAGENVVEFAPETPGDEEPAKLATQYVNYILQRRNPGFQIICTWIKDAMLQKTGILKVWWEDKRDEARETYDGLDAQALAKLLEDPEIEPIEHSERVDEEALERGQQRLQQMQAQFAQAQAQGAPLPALQQMAQQLQQAQAQMAQPPMLHDVVVKRAKRRAGVKIENVPPEEFLIHRQAKSIKDARFVAHRVIRTISELRAAGYSNLDNLGSDDAGGALNPERFERASVDDEYAGLFTESLSNTGDESGRQVWVTECYLQCDYDGDGIAEWRKVTRCGSTLLDNEECDGPPFVSITPIPLPHRFNGLSIADLAMPVQKNKTAVIRALLDNLYLQVNGRYFAVDGAVNLDDLLISRPGGVVRVKDAAAVGRLDQGQGDISSTFQVLDYLDMQKENRTGWTRHSQGVDGDALNPNKTATEVNTTTNRADVRIELIARVFAETGFTDLFYMILKLVSQHQDEEAQMAVAGNWVSVNPREWRNKFGITVNVGLGTGNKDQIVAHLMQLIGVQMNALQVGFATPQNLYESAMKLAENLQLPQPEKFFTSPQQMPQRPPQPPPEVIKAQAQMQVEQAKGQMHMQVEQQKAQVQAQVDQNRQEMEARQQALKIQSEQQLAQFTANLAHQAELQRLEFERWREQFRAQAQVQLEQMRLGARAQEAAMNREAAEEAAEEQAETDDNPAD